MKDYFLQIKIKNAPMMRAMRMAGFKTAAELSRQCDVHQGQIGCYLNLKRAPINKKGDWQPSVLKIACTLNTIPENLFPEHHLTKALEKNTTEVEVSLDQMMQLSQCSAYESPEIQLIEEENNAGIREILDVLSDREKGVLIKRYGLDDGQPMTLKATGHDYSVGTERVRQIEAKAFRKLRHHTKRKKLKELKDK